MRLISAIIPPAKLPHVCRLLRQARVPGVTVVEAKGFGKEMLAADIELMGYLMPVAKLEIAVNDDLVDEVVALIQKGVTSSKEGDGVVFVTEIVSATRIRTGESGSAVLD